MYRHFIERSPFELHVASNADFADGLVIHTQLRLPDLVHRLRKSRFGPRLAAWITDYENFIWPLTANDALEEAVQRFQPQIVLTLAECGLCHIARKTAQRHRLPLAGLFLDWFPVMKGHYGHKSTQRILSQRYRELYAACDLAFCTSDGMQEMLGPHPNSHVIYPMPGRHRVPEQAWPPRSGKFRVVYVGSVREVQLLTRTKFDIKARAVVDVLAMMRSPGANPREATLEYSSYDDKTPMLAGGPQYQLQPGVKVVVFANSFASSIPPGYLIQGSREELLHRVEALRDAVSHMSADQLKVHEINEEDRRIQLALYEKLSGYLRASK